MNGAMKWCTTLDASKMSFFLLMESHGKWLAADAIMRAAGGDDVNLVQQAYYNGHYGFSGGKAQHVRQADCMCYSTLPSPSPT
jgi:hypothetical protein